VNDKKIAYVCGPLTELPADIKKRAKRFYERIAGVCKEVTGERAFVPHEHYDPEEHANFIPEQVDEAERYQICKCTSLLIVVTDFGSSWGGGIEVEMANKNGISAVLMAEERRFKQGKVSRLLRGNPAVIRIIRYSSEEAGLRFLSATLPTLIIGRAIEL
jgi:hypothetical protein